MGGKKKVGPPETLPSPQDVNYGHSLSSLESCLISYQRGLCLLNIQNMSTPNRFYIVKGTVWRSKANCQYLYIITKYSGTNQYRSCYCNYLLYPQIGGAHYLRDPRGIEFLGRGLEFLTLPTEGIQNSWHLWREGYRIPYTSVQINFSTFFKVSFIALFSILSL